MGPRVLQQLNLRDKKKPRGVDLVVKKSQNGGKRKRKSVERVASVLAPNKKSKYARYSFSKIPTCTSGHHQVMRNVKEKKLAIESEITGEFKF